ncbi:MAG: hypothetical protein D6683_09530 [Actinomyces sp.]|nr:MAG: hypothetical protein D6683_09530 [Actinomyces sp.]
MGRPLPKVPRLPARVINEARKRLVVLHGQAAHGKSPVDSRVHSALSKLLDEDDPTSRQALAQILLAVRSVAYEDGFTRALIAEAYFDGYRDGLARANEDDTTN